MLVVIHISKIVYCGLRYLDFDQIWAILLGFGPLPGLQSEMPDSVKLLLRDAKYLGIHTDSL